MILEDQVFCGPSIVLTNVINPRSAIERKAEFQSTLIKKGATIGANATLVCGHTIGCHAFVGAGAVVTKDVPDYALAFGNPATVRGWVCQCGVRLSWKPNGADERAVCKSCGIQYVKRGENVSPVGVADLDSDDERR